MQFSLRTLFLLVLAAALLVALAKAQPIFSELMLATAVAYTGLAGLVLLFQFSVKRGYVLLPMLVVVPAIVLYFVTIAGTVALVLGLLIAGVSSI
jgi:hypothetical protein